MSPKKLRTIIAAAGAVALAATMSPALGAIAHPGVVSEDPADQIPQLVATAGIDRPKVEALTQIGGTGGTVYAGGTFAAVSEGDGTQVNGLSNLVAFDPQSGDVSPTFHASFNDTVLALASSPGALYVGGDFTTVNGSPRVALAKLDPTTGALDPNFRPNFTGGRINDLELRNGLLYVGGSSGQKLMVLNATTGRNTNLANLGISDAIPNAWGNVSVYQFAISQQGDRLIATGNFRTVGGQSRTRFFMADIDPVTGAVTLDPWYYQGFAKPCSSTQPRRIAYLFGLDFSPAGDYFVVAATGQIPRNRSDIWHPGVVNPPNTTVCDGAGRFDINNGDPTHQPTWINYTGGDSVWAVSITGAAAYVQGHFQYFDNPDGFASQCPTGQVCARRLGIAALDVQTGRALSWTANKPARSGGKAFLTTPTGLWVGSDSIHFGGELHRGLGFLPL